MLVQPDSGVPTPQVRMLRGSAWMIGWRWSIRLIGLVSTIILARLLTPADFGLVAMATLVVGLVEVFGDTGQGLAIIRHPHPKREHLDTTWTLSVCIGVALTIALFAVAPLGAAYFDEPRATLVIQFLALRTIIGSFENIGVVLFRKNQEFANDFRYLVCQKLLTFAITLSLAFALRTYWALVAGIVIGRALGVVLSYLMHPYRPRPTLVKLREIWSFSLWILISNMGGYLSEKTGEFVVGGIAGTSSMGHYNVASDVATAPTVELILPTERALFPVLATIVHDVKKLKQAYLDVLSVVAIASVSTGVGVAIVAKDMVAVVLGPQWGASASLMVWLALNVAVWGTCHGSITVLNVTGHARLTAMLTCLGAAMLAPSLTLGGLVGGVEGVAMAHLAVTLAFVPILFAKLRRAIPVSASEIVERLWRPVTAAAIMATAVRFLHPDWITMVPIRLLHDIVLGACVFTAVLTLLWLLAGQPAGVEQAGIRYLHRQWRRLWIR